MGKKNTLHPSVQQFKQFVKKHPSLINEVREGKKTWQDFYEEWTILGEEDKVWEKYLINQEKAEANEASDDEKNTKDSNGGDLLALLKNINLNDIQGHIENLSGMMSSLQGLLQSFQSNSKQQQGQQQQAPNKPFNFRQF